MQSTKNKVNKTYIKEFSVDTSFLTEEERTLLNKLVEATKLVSAIYRKQIESGFYPKDATKQEIEKAASQNPAILDPYTMVERNKEGKLIAIPYHIKYQELLIPIAEKLTEAAQISGTPKDFRENLLIRAKGLLNGKYKQTIISWMKTKPYMIDAIIDPIERIEDRMFFVKRTYQGWVGLKRQNYTERFNLLKDVVFSSRRQLFKSEKVDFMDKARIRVDETVIFTGMIANYDFTATTLPNDLDLLEKYGSVSWIFLPKVKEEFESHQYKLFQLIFDKSFQNSFSKEQLLRGYLLMIAMHEIARVAVQYRFAQQRLKELYPVFNELTIEAMAVKMAGTLLVKDYLSQKEMEVLLIMFLTRIFDQYRENTELKKGSEQFVLGNAMLLNSLMASGALKITRSGISWPNFTKMFISVSELADSMEKILALGTYKDAESYMKKYSSLSVFKSFSRALKTLQ